MGYLISSLGSTGFKKAPESFLFSLVNPSGLPPTKMPLMARQEEDAIICNFDCGPVFGSADLFIPDKPHVSVGSTRLNSSYKCPSGQKDTFLTGDQNFTVSEMEVFGLNR